MVDVIFILFVLFVFFFAFLYIIITLQFYMSGYFATGVLWVIEAVK